LASFNSLYIWLFLITVLESSGSEERESFFQISAKNKGISQYGEAVSLNVSTQEKGKDNASVICLIYIEGGAKRTHVFQIIVTLFIFNIK